MCNANIIFRFQSFLYFKVLYAGLKKQNPYRIALMFVSICPARQGQRGINLK